MASKPFPPPPIDKEAGPIPYRRGGDALKALASALVAVIAVSIAIATGSNHPFWYGIALAALMISLGFLVAQKKPLQDPDDEITGRALFEIVPCYISVQDPQLRIVKSNALFRRDFGNQIGRYCFGVYKDRASVCPDCPVKKTFSDGQSHSREETVVMKGGRLAHMIVYSSPLRNKKGEITYVMEMMTDITAVKQLQQELEKSREEYQRLFDVVPCYLSIQDREFRILETNALFKRNFGDLKGELCHKAYKGRNSVCTNCPAAKSLQDGASHSSEEIVITRDGEAAHMIVYSMPLRNDRGEIDRVMEMSTNITEVKKLQRELTTIGKAVAGMAHRVKNILMGLEGGIFVVNTGMETQDNDTIKEGWEMIERNVGKVSKIVKDMLFCSKTREPVFEDVSPEEIAREVYALFESRVVDEGIALRLEVSDNPHKGLFDPDSLHSLMTNLVTNAIGACKFDMNEGKEQHVIILRCLHSSEGETVVEVSDNGSGMAEEVQSKIFNDLFSTKGSEGTGFGLLVAQKVVEEHGGTLTFESKEGQGTTFRAVFPPQRSVK